MTSVHTHNAIGHFDIAGPDADVLVSFYKSVFGWAVASAGPGYSRLTTPTVAGAVVESPEASLTIGVVVPDLDGAVAQAATAGGQVVMAPTDNGWVRKAQVRDPAGNVLTLIQS